MKKIIKQSIFRLFYGKTKKIISFKDNKNIFFKKIHIKKKFIYNFFKITNGRLFSNTTHDTAYIVDNCLIKEASFQYRFKKKSKIINGNIKDNHVVKYGTPNFIKKIRGSVFSMLSGGAAKNNYWHWIFDTLPKIGILEKSKIKADYYLAPSLSKKYQMETLLNLKISSKKLLDGRKFRHIVCDNLLTTDHPVVFNNDPTKSILDIPIWIIEWHRNKFLSKNYSTKKLPKKIFMDREKDSSLVNRKIINNEEVKVFLEKYGFESLSLSNYSFMDQVKIFNNANFIIGLHGSGFANMLFSKPGTKVIEIQSKNTGKLMLNLAKKCKLKYKRIIEKNESSNLSYQNSHVRVNITKLKKQILSF